MKFSWSPVSRSREEVENWPKKGGEVTEGLGNPKEGE